MLSRASRSSGTLPDWQSGARRCPSAPSDQALRHRVGDRSRIATRVRTFRPDLLETVGNAFNPFAHKGGVAVAYIFRADVDDAAGIDDVVRSVKNSPRMQARAVFGGGELIVRAAGD